MSYQYVILADPEEGWDVKADKVLFANNESGVEDCVRQIAGNNCQATICVYSLNELRKIKRKPEYQRYIVKDGEILPQ